MKINDDLELVRVDERNLGIRRKGKIIGFYGTVEGAMKAVLKYAVVGSQVEIEAKNILQEIESLNQTITTLYKEGKPL